MKKLRVLDLFSGIGGFSLGLECTGGFETVAFCEIEPYCQKVLAKHWAGVPIYDDVRELRAERLATDGIGVDVITGGFPCQDISNAGKGAGIGEGTRSGLWSECARLLGDIRLRYAIFENVTALLSGDSGRWFEQVLWDISQVGYDAEWHCIPASELGAHHHRDRVWIVAYPALDGGSRVCGEFPQKDEQQATQRQEGWVRQSIDAGSGRLPAKDMAHANSAQCEGGSLPGGILAEYGDFSCTGWWETEPAVDRVAYGIHQQSHRLKALGNAVVPQIPEIIGRAINRSFYDSQNP